MSTELYIPPQPQIKLSYNPKNGQFLKGHTPTNKGKTWDEFMSKKGQRRCKKGWKNLDTHRSKGNPEWAERKKKQVVAITDDGRFTVLPYIVAAASWLERRTGEKCCPENISRCCRQNSSGKVLKKPWGADSGKVNTDHKYKGIRFYFEADVKIWKTKII